MHLLLSCAAPWFVVINSQIIQSEIDMTIYSEDTVIDEQSRATSHKDFIYKEHLSANAIEEGTANGNLRIGIFHAVHVFVSGNAEKQKSVELDDGSIDGETLNIAQNGSSHYGVHESLNLVGDDEEEHENHPVTVKHGVIKGEIVGIIQRAQRDYVACLDETEEVAVSVFNSRRQEQLLCVPMDQRIPLVRVASRQRSQLLMSEAEYISTREVPESSAFYHYGLALEFYTHFTSPIR
jgi:exoribonuclease R